MKTTISTSICFCFREHVSKFNSMLEKRLLGERHLHWLDMVEGLYDTETKAFKYGKITKLN